MNIIIGSNYIELWQAELIRRLISNSKVTILTMVIQPTEKFPPFYLLLQKFETFVHNIPEYARNLVDIHSLGIDGEYEMVDSLEDLCTPCDVLLNLSSSLIPETLLSQYRLGMWEYFFGIDNHIHIGLDEVINRYDALYCSLHMRNTSEVKLLYQSWSPINSLYVHKTAHCALWKSMCFVERSLNNLPKMGTKIDRPVITKHKSPISQSLRYFWNYLSFKLTRKKFTEQWVLAFSPHVFDFNFKDFLVLIPPNNRFWADPFLVKKDKLCYVFAEEFGYKPYHKGKIVCLTLDENMRLLKTEVILSKPYHLSYPFVFEFEGQYYMIPETSQNKTIEIYRACSFPGQWKFVMNLAEEIEAVDTTLLYHDSIWWKFTNIKAVGGASSQDELFLFYADSPITRQWTPHPQNPIVSDVRVARPAGKLFIRNGKLFRPSQNSSFYYGYGLCINEVKVLSKDIYEEEIVESFAPDWNKNVKKLHTVNFAENLTMIDIRRKL